MKNNSSAQDQSNLASIVQAAGPRRFGKTRIVGALLLLLLIVGSWFFWNRAFASKSNGPSYITSPLSRGNISLTITATGNLEPTNEVTVGSELSGTISDVYVETNDRVTKGQPLAKLDTTKLQQETQSSRAKLRAAEATVAQVKATVKESAATLLRYQELRKLSGGKLPSQADYDTAEASADRAKADLLSAEASVAQAQATLSINETDLGKAIITSPMDGIVLTRNIEPGQTVQASYSAPELFVIAENLEHMKLVVTVAEADIGRLKDGLPSTFTVDAWPDRTYHAKVLKVAYGSAVTDNVVTYETELEVSNQDLSLRPGMTATSDIRVAESKNVFLVPTAALRFDPSQATMNNGAQQKKTFIQSLTPMPPRRQSRRSNGDQPDNASGNGGRSRIWVLQNEQPHPITVQLGLTDGRMTEVTGEGLTENLPIITNISMSAAR